MFAKQMVGVAAVAAVVALVSTGVVAQQITIPTVRVGDVGNAPDPLTGFGSVSYAYDIGTYEVTAGQYTAFLNAVARTDTNGLYTSQMASTVSGSGITQSGVSGNYTYAVSTGFANRPVNHVNFWSAARFANWLNNGQPTGIQGDSTTETGAYTLTAGGISGNTVVRNAGAQWAVASEDEWYKAAYYKGGGANAGYWLYPTRSDTPPGRDLLDPTGNNANHYLGVGAFPIDNLTYTTAVGQFQNSAGPYGTFDQGGNVVEWTEAKFLSGNRILRGGSYSSTDVFLAADGSTAAPPGFRSAVVGFRVVQVPAPSVVGALAMGGFLAARRRRSVGRG